MLDVHAYNVSFEDLVKKTAGEFFDFQTSESRSSAGNQQIGASGFAAPRNEEEYVKMMREAKTPEEQVKVMESYQSKTK